MNDLNSILIEGRVTFREAKPMSGIFRFDVTSRRVVKPTASINTEAGLRVVETVVGVLTYGTLADRCHESLTVGRGVRVVGRLQQQPTNELVIIGEHVEFKPVQPAEDPSDNQPTAE